MDTQATIETLRNMWKTIGTLTAFGESKGYEVDTESDTDEIVSVYFSTDTDDEALSIMFDEGTTKGQVLSRIPNHVLNFSTFGECTQIVKGIMAIQFIDSMSPDEMEGIARDLLIHTQGG